MSIGSVYRLKFKMHPSLPASPSPNGTLRPLGCNSGIAIHTSKAIYICLMRKTNELNYLRQRQRTDDRGATSRQQEPTIQLYIYVYTCILYKQNIRNESYECTIHIYTNINVYMPPANDPQRGHNDTHANMQAHTHTQIHHLSTHH